MVLDSAPLSVGNFSGSSRASAVFIPRSLAVLSRVVVIAGLTFRGRLPSNVHFSNKVNSLFFVEMHHTPVVRIELPKCLVFVRWT